MHEGKSSSQKPLSKILEMESATQETEMKQ